MSNGLLDSKALSNKTHCLSLEKPRLLRLSQLRQEIIYSDSAVLRSKPFPVAFSALGINNEFTFFLLSEVLLIKGCQKLPVIGRVETGVVSRESTIILTLFL